MKYYIGIDVGTSGLKAVAFDRNGTICASKEREYNIIAPSPLWAEENPLDWREAAISTLKDIASIADPDDIVGIGLTGQMHGLVMLDENDNVLDNAIIWCDNRCEKEAEEIKGFGSDRIKAITGNYPMQAFTLAKLLWIRNNKPKIYKRIAKIMLPKDYIRYILTGEFKAEYSDASGMQMMDLKNECWSEEILTYFNIDKSILPSLVESDSITGYIKDDISKETGLSKKTFVVGGAGDQAAGALGNGVISGDDVSISLGSSGVVFSSIDRLDNMNDSLQYFHHAIKGKYHTMAVTNGCGNSLKWYKNLFCQEEIEKCKGENVYAYITRNIQSISPGVNGLIYLPYIMGERTPHLDPKATGLFIGLRGSTSKDELTRSVIEGISYSIRDCFELLDGNTNKILISGGGARNDDWCNIISSMLGKSLCKINVSESPALGVAMLAMVRAGEYKDINDAASSIIKITEVYNPNMDDKNIYDKYFEIYKELYNQNKAIYERLGNIK